MRRVSDRAVSPVVAIVVLLLITLVLAGTLGVTVLNVSPSEPTRATFTLSADSTTQTITVTHRGGAALDPSSLRLRITVGGDPIAHQPPVPFFAAEGFMGGPSGPFNSAYEGEWVAGQSASVRLASTNTRFRSGSELSIRLYADDQLLAQLETRAD